MERRITGGSSDVDQDGVGVVKESYDVVSENNDCFIILPSHQEPNRGFNS